MMQASLNLVLACQPEVIWTVLGDMVRNPARYEEKVTLKRMEAAGGPNVTRKVERQGRVLEEHVTFHIDALMVEVACKDQNLTLIHQVVPSGEVTLLNLAANWDEPDDDAELDPASPTQETVDQRLAALGKSLKATAEGLT